jgi:hypothetical protein
MTLLAGRIIHDPTRIHRQGYTSRPATLILAGRGAGCQGHPRVVARSNSFKL